jgi:transposase-like protein
MDIPKDLLNKEFLSQFKTEEDVSKFLTNLHSKVLEQMLEEEMDAHLGYEKHAPEGNNSGNSRNGKYSKRYRPIMENQSSKYPEIVRESLNQR